MRCAGSLGKCWLLFVTGIAHCVSKSAVSIKIKQEECGRLIVVGVRGERRHFGDMMAVKVNLQSGTLEVRFLCITIGVEYITGRLIKYNLSHS